MLVTDSGGGEYTVDLRKSFLFFTKQLQSLKMWLFPFEQYLCLSIVMTSVLRNWNLGVWSHGAVWHSGSRSLSSSLHCSHIEISNKKEHLPGA